MKRRVNKKRKIYQTLKGTHRKGGDAIYKVRDKILNGYLLSVDPASVSLGYAVYHKGVLVKSGNLMAPSKAAIGDRLRRLTVQLAEETEEFDISVLAVEFLRTGVGHHFLVWSVGAVVSAVPCDHVVEVHTQSWRKLTTSSYVKSDENDAIAIGKFAVEIAKETE